MWLWQIWEQVAQAYFKILAIDIGIGVNDPSVQRIYFLLHALMIVICLSSSLFKFNWLTFVSKSLWYRTFKKLDCSLIWNFYRMYQSIHSSNCANFMKK